MGTDSAYKRWQPRARMKEAKDKAVRVTSTDLATASRTLDAATTSPFGEILTAGHRSRWVYDLYDGTLKAIEHGSVAPRSETISGSPPVQSRTHSAKSPPV